MHEKYISAPPLRWQSQLLLLIVVPVSCIWIFLQALQDFAFHDPVLLQMAGLSIVFGLIVWIARAATGYAAITGAVITACLYLRTPGWRTTVFPLITMLVLTLAATRIGRDKKKIKDRRVKTWPKRGASRSQPRGGHARLHPAYCNADVYSLCANTAPLAGDDYGSAGRSSRRYALLRIGAGFWWSAASAHDSQISARRN